MSVFGAKKLVLVIAMMTVAGCASLGMRSPGVPSNPWQQGGRACEDASKPTAFLAATPGGLDDGGATVNVGVAVTQNNKCTFDQAIAAVGKAQSFCMDLREYYERGGEITGSQRLFVGVLGTLAGSVFSVIASGNAIKAWAGLSGATNGIQTQLSTQTNARGGPAVIEKIANAQIQYSQNVLSFLNAAEYDKVVAASVLLPDQCSAQAGLGLAVEAMAATAAASAASAANRSASAAEAAASAARKAAVPAATN